MDVTRKNFKELLPSIADTISNCDFIAIDGEFTGLSSGGHGIHSFETPEERYQKLRKTVTDFLMVQYGLCTFKYDEEKKSYIAKAFNFYIFPKPFTRQAPDVRFLCQSSSIDFLANEGFDFNKVFKEGIPYLTPADEQKLREGLEQKHLLQQQQQNMMFSSPAFTSPTGVDTSIAKGPLDIPDDQKEFITGICTKVEEFVGNSEAVTLNLDPCSAFRRRLIYQTVKLKFQSGLHLETKTGEDKRHRYIVISKVTDEKEIREKEVNKRAAEMEELEDAVGFSKVIKLISQSGKLVIGHNMLLDLLHTLNQFSCPLPEDYEDFKSLTHCIFPRLLDTKLMAATPPFKDLIMSSALGDLQKFLENKPFIKPAVEVAEDFPSYSTNSEKLHEAGYDAYITGLCFIGMANHLGTYQKPPKDRTPPSSPLLEPFINKVFLMRIQDIPYMNLIGPDLIPSRDHVFHVTFPKEWRATDLQQLFSPFGGINIGWIDDTSAFVSLYRRDDSTQVIKSLAKQDSIFKIQTYNNFMEGKTTTSRKRSLPSSDIDLPVKKRKTPQLNADVSPFVPKRSITPIPEEVEQEEGKASSNGSTQENDKSSANGSVKTLSMIEEDLGAPVCKKKKKSEPVAGGEKLFEEPSW